MVAEGAFLHDYYFTNSINPIAADTYSGWDGNGFRNYPDFNISNTKL